MMKPWSTTYSKFGGSELWNRETYYGPVGSVSEKTIRKYIENLHPVVPLIV